MGDSTLWTLIRPFSVGVVGLSDVCFHLFWLGKITVVFDGTSPNHCCVWRNFSHLLFHKHFGMEHLKFKYNSLHSMEHFTFNNTMERSPIDWCHQHLPVGLLLPSVNFTAALYLFCPGCCSWSPHNNLQEHQALWFDCHILQRARRE